ncbi:MAG: DUF5069 domain-containing protein [Chthoniobacterales bacterium]
MKSPDLTLRAPRSPRVRLGGYAILPRVLDKARATLAGTAGEYIYGNPLDHFFLGFTGLTPEDLLEPVKAGASDWDVLQWVNARAKRAPHEIRAWSAFVESMPIGDAGDLAWFADQSKRLNPARTDIQTIIDYLDADDFVSFGGAA